MSSFSGDRGAELRQIFFESAQEILQSINEQALRLEKHPDDLEALRSLRRAVHTLKGDAAACGFRELSHLAHEFEDALVAENLAQSAATVETALTAADVFGEMLEAYSTGKAVSTAKTLQEMIKRLAKPDGATTRHKTRAKPKTASSTAKPIASGKNGAKKRTQKTGKAAQPAPAAEISADPALAEASAPHDAEPHWTEYEQVAIDAAQHRAEPLYRVRLAIDANCAMLEAGLQIVHKVLTRAGAVLAFSPATAKELEASRRIHAVVSSTEAQPTLARKCRVPGIEIGR